MHNDHTKNLARRWLLATSIAVAAMAILVGAEAVSARAARAVGNGQLTIYADPYSTGAANPISDSGSARVQAITTPNGKTIVTLHVRGLPANRAFGAHVHILGCDNNKAGGHYRNDPAGPATPENEIWLDFTSNAAGRGQAHAVVDFAIRPGAANAVVIHDRHTDAAGAAGAKLACLNVGF